MNSNNNNEKKNRFQFSHNLTWITFRVTCVVIIVDSESFFFLSLSLFLFCFSPLFHFSLSLFFCSHVCRKPNQKEKKLSSRTLTYTVHCIIDVDDDPGIKKKNDNKKNAIGHHSLSIPSIAYIFFVSVSLIFFLLFILLHLLFCYLKWVRENKIK